MAASNWPRVCRIGGRRRSEARDPVPPARCRARRAAAPDGRTRRHRRGCDALVDTGGGGGACRRIGAGALPGQGTALGVAAAPDSPRQAAAPTMRRAGRRNPSAAARSCRSAPGCDGVSSSFWPVAWARLSSRSCTRCLQRRRCAASWFCFVLDARGLFLVAFAERWDLNSCALAPPARQRQQPWQRRAR